MSSMRSVASVPAELSFIPPQMPTPVDTPPTGSGWIHEIKQDGWRIQVIVEGGKARVLTRRGLDWTSRFKAIAQAAGAIRCRSAIIDGEAVVKDAPGESGEASTILSAYDLLHFDGQDLCGLPLTERRDRLADLVFGIKGAITYCDSFTGSTDELFAAAERHGVDGIVSKKVDSPYRSGPSKQWLKAKLWDEEEFTLVGLETDDEGSAIPLLAREHAGLFAFAGAATGGMPDNVRERVAALLPAARVPIGAGARRDATWLEPILRVKVRHRRGGAGTELRNATVTGLVER